MATIRRPPPLDNSQAIYDWLDRDIAGLVTKLNEEREFAQRQAEELARRYALLVSN